MPSGQITSIITVGGLNFKATHSRSASGQIGHTVELAAGKAGTIDASGVNNLATAHGIIATNVVDVHWTDPSTGLHKCRRGLLVDVANANDIDFDETPAGVGDALPANGTACVVSVQVPVDTDFDGDLMDMYAITATQRVMADFFDASVSLSAQKVPAGEALSWVSNTGVANPLTGNPVAQVKLSNGSAVAATVTLGILYQST